MFELCWDPNPGAAASSLARITIESVQQLDRELERLERLAKDGDPFVIELREPTRGALGIGVGRHESFATYEPADGLPPYQLSVDDENRSPDDVLVFFHGEWTELPGTAAIPSAAAREAMRRFFLTGECPDNVRWTEV